MCTICIPLSNKETQHGNGWIIGHNVQRAEYDAMEPVPFAMFLPIYETIQTPLVPICGAGRGPSREHPRIHPLCNSRRILGGCSSTKPPRQIRHRRTASLQPSSRTPHRQEWCQTFHSERGAGDERKLWHRVSPRCSDSQHVSEFNVPSVCPDPGTVGKLNRVELYR
jgi:hypothetical protein